MKILSINNRQPKFNARLPKSQKNLVIEAAQSKDGTGIPKMYTLLQQLDQMQGVRAELKKFPLGLRFYERVGFGRNEDPQICQIRIDGKLVQEGDTIYETIYDAVTSTKTKDGKKVNIPKEMFTEMWKENVGKTFEDIEAFFID